MLRLFEVCERSTLRFLGTLCLTNRFSILRLRMGEFQIATCVVTLDVSRKSLESRRSCGCCRGGGGSRGGSRGSGRGSGRGGRSSVNGAGAWFLVLVSHFLRWDHPKTLHPIVPVNLR